eukprot:scaffold5626_cov258-Ochromonas_danica.AAC.16
MASHHPSRLSDDMTDIVTVKSHSLPPPAGIFWFDTVTSTMDKARELIQSQTITGHDVKCIVTEKQTNGRGTRGRKWFYGDKNIYLTLIIHRDTIPIPLSLLPIRSGTLLANALLPHLTRGEADMKLKWPNDILLNDKKLCGTLIEMERDYLLIGIGCNLMTTPVVAVEGVEGGRPATSLAPFNHILNTYAQSLLDHNTNNDKEKDGEKDQQALLQSYCQSIIVDIFEQFRVWIESQSDSAINVVEDFERNMVTSPQRLRDDHFSKNQAIDDAGRERCQDDTQFIVQPIGLNLDGTLK